MPLRDIEEILCGLWSELLRTSVVGRYDNFFCMGGDSLLAAQLARCLQYWDIWVDTALIFEFPTVADLAGALLDKVQSEHQLVPENRIPIGSNQITPQMLPLVHLEAEEIERIVQAVPGGAANIEDIYPLVSSQEEILSRHLLEEQYGDTAVVSVILSVSSWRRLEDFIAALQKVIDHHDVLRTAILWEQLTRPVQVVYRSAVLPVEEVRLNRDESVMKQMRCWLRPERQRLNLRQAPLMRLQVAPHAYNGQWYVWLQFHRIVMDRSTSQSMVSEIVANLQGQLNSPSDLRPYRDYVAWTNKCARRVDGANSLWTKIPGATVAVAWQVSGTDGDTPVAQEASEQLDADLAQRLSQLARQSKVTRAALFHAAWGLAFARITGSYDIVFGSALLSGAYCDDVDSRWGVFVNNLPLRLRLEDQTVTKLLERAQCELIDLLRHECPSAQRRKDALPVAPSFTTLLNYCHAAPRADALWDRAEGVRFLLTMERAGYPITLTVEDRGTSFELIVHTCRSIDARRVIAHMRAAVLFLLEALDQAPNTLALAFAGP